jgi:RNA polymerase sigma-70 factor, ECF subfamily
MNASGMEQKDPWATAAIEQNRRWLAAFVLCLTRDLNSCDDIVQDVLRIAYEKRDSFESGTNFGAWLRGIARNVVHRHFDGLRQDQLLDSKAVAAELDQAAARHEEVDAFDETEQGCYLRECLKELPERSRNILHLRYYVVLRIEELAARIGMKTEALYVTISRLRQKLRECVRQKEQAARSVKL